MWVIKRETKEGEARMTAILYHGITGEMEETNTNDNKGFVFIAFISMDLKLSLKWHKESYNTVYKY